MCLGLLRILLYLDLYWGVILASGVCGSVEGLQKRESRELQRIEPAEVLVKNRVFPAGRSWDV